MNEPVMSEVEQEVDRALLLRLEKCIFGNAPLTKPGLQWSHGCLKIITQFRYDAERRGYNKGRNAARKPKVK